MTDNKRKLYDVLSKDYDLGTFEQFSSGLEDEEKRKKAYEAAKASYDLGDFDKFSADLGFTKQAEPVVGDQTQSVRQDAGVEVLNFDDKPQVETQAPEVPETPQEQRARLEEAMRPFDETVGPLAPSQRKEYDLLMQQYKSNPLVQLDERISAAEKEAEEYGRKAHEIANKYRAQVGYQPYTTSWGMVGNAADDLMNADPEYNKYMVAENNKRQEARQLRHIRDGKANNFWTNIGDVFADPNTWTLGFWSAKEGLTRRDAEKSEEDESSQILLQSIVGRQIADAESEEERHFWGRAGRLAGNMIPFAIQIATTKGLFGGIGAGVKGAVTSKLGTSVVARATGALAGDLAYGAAMAGTVGSGQVIGNTIQNMSGEIVKGEDGNYHALDGYYKPDAEGDFQDAEGNRYSFEETPSWFSAGYKAFMGQTLEYSTEMFGDHLQHGIGRLIAKGAKKSGKQALHPAVEAIVKNWDVNPEDFGLKAASRDAMRSTGAQLASGMVKYLDVAGIQGYPFEGLEEEANIIFGAFFGTGEKWMDFSPLWDGETQADIWGGMFFSAGLMQAAPFVASVGIEAHNAGKAKAYTKIATKLDAASDNAAVTLGERWEAIKAQIDDTDNAGIPAFMNDVRNSEEYSDEEKLAIGQYVANLEKFRGFNQGTMTQAREAIEQGSDVGVFAEEPQRLTVEADGQIDGAYIAGYNSPEEQQNDIAKSFDIAQKRLKDATGLDAISDEAVGDFLRDPNRTPEQKQAVIDYKMAYEAKQGMFQHVRDEIFRKIAASNRTIDRNTSKTDGMIHPVTLKVGDRRAYIVDGNAVMTEDGTTVDHTKSMHDLLLRDAESGEIFFASIDQILSVDDALDPLAEKEVVAEQIRQSIGQDAANRIDGILPFNQNDIYDLADFESGQMFKIQIVANEEGLVDNGDGTVNVVLNPQDGQPATISQMPKEQIQSLVDNARNLLLMSWANEIDKARAARQRMQHTVDEEIPEDLPEGLAQTPQADAQPVAEEKPSIPVDDKGRKQYMQAPSELTYEDIYSDEDFESEEEAYGFINGKVKRAKEALDKQQGAVNKIKPEDYDTPSEYRAAKNKALEAAKPFQDTYDYWKSVLDLADADIAAAKEREARAARMEELELEEPQSLEALVANAFRGMKHGLSKEDFKKETGLGETELKKFFPFWAKKGHGLSVQAFAESITADDTSGLIPMIGDAEQYDTQAVRNAIIEVFRSASKPSDIFDYTRNLNLQMKAEEARLNAEAEERARYEAEHAAAAQAAEPVVEEPAATVVEQPETSTVLENEQAVQTPLQQTIEAAREEVDVEPTEAQKKAGNYKMGHIKIDGREITIENPKGSVRKGKDANGKEWQTEMHHDYGYLRKTEGVDADPIDIFLSDNPEEGNVFVVDQVDPQTGQFDEHKVMYGFNSLEEAKAAYLSNYEEGWQGLGNITEVSRDEFKKWIESSHRKTKPFAEYKSVKPVQEEASSTVVKESLTTETEAPEVVEATVPATLEEAKAALHNATRTADDKPMFPEVVHVGAAVREMDVTGRELMQAESTKKTRDGIIGHLKNYIDKLAEQFSARLAAYDSPEAVISTANQKADELLKKAESEQMDPYDFEDAMNAVVEDVKILLRKMRYDKPSDVTGRYDLDTMDESGYKEDVASLLKGASKEVLFQLLNKQGDIPWAAFDVVRTSTAAVRNLNAAQSARQMYFDAHPEMPSATPTGKFDIWKFILKDKMKPALGGVFHDKGFKVASDSHILVALKEAYPKENEGKILDKKKAEIKGNFPKWRDLIKEGTAANIDVAHLASFVEGVKQQTGKDFKDVRIAIPVDGQIRLFSAPLLENFLRAVQKIDGKLSYRPLGETGKSMMLQAEGKDGYALIISAWNENWTSPMFHFYATPEETAAMAKEREQAHTVAEAQSFVTGRPVEEIEAEQKAAQKPWTPQEKWDAAEKALAEAKSAEERREAIRLRKEALEDKMQVIADAEHPVTVTSYDDVIEDLTKQGLPEDRIEEVKDGLELDNPRRSKTRGFYIPGYGIYLVADDVKSIDDGVTTYVHERQHQLTEKDNLAEAFMSLPGFYREKIWEVMRKWNASPYYQNEGTLTIADEFLSMAMERAYQSETSDVFEQELRKVGIENEEIINFVKNIDNEQRGSQSLSSARNVTLFQDSEQGSRSEDDGDKGPVSGGSLGQEGNRPAQSSESSTRRSSRAGEIIKTGPSRQIEDFGEKIAGARKDELRNLSKTLEDATEETFVALPLAKAFKRPNTKKLIENGIISQEDAALVDAVSWLILGSPKPVKLKDRSYKARRRDEEIITWAKDQARRAKVLLDYINADAAGKQAIIESLADVPEDIKASEDYNRKRIVEMNRGWKDLTVGELYPLNPIYVAYRVFQNTGYDPDVNGRIKFPIIKCDTLGKSYTVKSGSYGYEQAQSVDEAINQASYLIQLQMGAEDLDHPASAFRVRGIREKKVGSGRFIVSYIIARRSRLSAEQKEFDSKEAALEFARKQYKDRPESEIESNIYEPQVWAPATSFKIVGLNAATGEEYDLEGKYDSPEEAREAIDSKHEELNTQMNQAIQKSNEAKGESGKKRDKLYVAFYHENGKSSYGVWADDKGFWMGSALLRGGFETSKEARAYMEEHRAEFETMLKDMAKKRSEFVFFDGDAQSRKGKDYRQGKNVGEEEYKAFGFRGVQFGNWANDSDRQAALNNAYDSFMNLAELLGVSPAALSLNGELGLAFGARGSGSANAHYESDEVVINLTKTRGAGSLAHEWWHALDNYFARRGGIAHGFITASKIPGARPELQQAFDELSKGIRASDYGKRSAQRGDYWKSDWEMTARLFAEWIERRIAEKGESDHFLVRGVTDEDMERWQDLTYAFYKARMKGLGETPISFDEFKKTPESLVGYPYPTTEEIKTTLGPLMQKVVDTISEKSEDGKTVLFSKTVSPITTYHGSGASFNQFDLQFLGSGEGTDVYGPGVYVSEVDGIAKSYANVAAGNRLAEVRDGIDRQEARLQEIRAGYPAKIAYHDEAAARMEGTRSADIHKRFADNYRYMLETGDYKYDAEAQEIQDNIKARQQMLSDEGKRHLYTVEIPGDNGHNYLVFGEEVPIQDAMRIKAALRARLLADPNSGYNASVIRELDDELNMAFRNIFGDQLLGTLDAYLGNDGVGFKSTQFLHDLGYVGIKVDTNYQDPNGDHTANNYVIFDPKDAHITEHVRFSKLNQWPVEDREQSHVRFSKVTDQKVLEGLEKGETEIGYRNVVLNEDGTLGSPMADKLGKKGQKSVSTIPFAFDEWEQSDEHPEMATDEGKINLIKPDKLGNVDAVDYNPYIHIRPTLLNKQFTGAWKRPNLVYVAVEYPTSELTSGYHAEKAAKSVGRHEWNGGDLILSRYDKPVRIVSWDEVADEWVKEFKDRGVTFDIVPPGLLPVLVERGLDILPPKTAAGAPARAAYERFSRRADKVRFSKVTPEQDQEYLAAVEAGDMKKAQRMVSEAFKAAYPNTKIVDENGNPLVMYHGTGRMFNEFKDNDTSSELGAGFYFTDNKRVADGYTNPKLADNQNKIEARAMEIFTEDMGHTEEDSYDNEYVGDYNKAYDQAKSELFGSPRVMPVFLNVANPRHVAEDGTLETGRGEHDGVIDDTFAKRHGSIMIQTRAGEHAMQVMVYDANQIKSAEPVTRDEDGKVIPLSKRFDTGRKDIRFSKVYHGTGADFDKFDMGHVGEGEGEMAHGYGLYMTFDKETGAKYAWQIALRDAEAKGLLSKDVMRIIYEDYYDSYEEMVERYDKLLQSHKEEVEEDYRYALEEDKDNPRFLARRKKEYDEVMALRPMDEVMKDSRQLYTIEIPDDNGENYIDEMRTLPKHLRKRIADLVREIPEEKLARKSHGPNWLPDGFKTLANVIEREQYAGLEIRKRLEDALGNTVEACKEVSDLFHRAGFVGMKYNGRADGPCVVIFDEKDLRVDRHVRFSKTNETERIFISNAEKAAENIKMEKATPEQWLKMLEKDGGLKAGEDKWLGLSDWLRASDKKTITKQEVLDFIRKNEIVIEEENYGELELSQLQNEFDQIYDDIIDGLGEENEDELELYQVVMSPAERAWDELKSRYYGGDDFDMAFELDDQMKISVSDEDRAGFFLGVKPINSTRLDYSTAGLDNKREIALIIPSIEPWNEHDDVHFGDAGEGRAIAWIRFGDTRAKRKETPERKAHIALEAELESKYGRTFMSPESSITDEEREAFNESWLKANKSETIFGEKVLFIDEIQSKRHQEGREKGYADKDAQAKFDEVQRESREYQESLAKKYHTDVALLDNYWTEEEQRKIGEYTREKKKYADMLVDAVPAAPFEKNWHELAFKRMLRLAAEEGYDIVAWTTGEQQADRYDLSTSVDEIRVIDAGMGEHEIRGFKDGKNVLNQTVTDGEKGLAAYIGKDMARKAYATLHEGDQTYLVNDTYAAFKGDDLRIGGEGMKGFYDDILPRFVNKYGKKWGITVYDQKLPAIEHVAHMIDVTPEMKESVKRGQVMFSKVSRFAESKDEFDKTVEEAAASKGIVADGLSDREIQIHPVTINDYDGVSTQKVYKDFINGKTFPIEDVHPDGFSFYISKDSIGEFVNRDAVSKSEQGGASRNLHLSILPELAEIIKKSIDAEIHPDYIKVGNSRSAENGYNEGVLIHRLYGAISADGKLFRVKTTVKEYRDTNRDNKAYSYEVTKIELIDDSSDGAKKGSSRPLNPVNNSIVATKLLKGVEKSYDSGKKLLEVGKKPLFSKLERPVEEIVNDGKQKVSNETDEARAHLNERMRAIDDNLAKLRMAASAQREYDRETVRSITDLAKDLLKNGALSDVTRQEIEKMLTVTRWATGRKDLQGAVQTIMDLMVANQLRHSENVLKSLLKIRGSKVDARGVEVQGQLDAPGQRMMQAFKTAMDMSPEAIDEHIAGAEERLDSEDDTIKAAAGDELVGLQMARKYVEDIKSSIEEEKGIKDELRYAAEDRRARKMHPASYREFVESSEEALRQNRMERIASYNELIDGLSHMLYDSIARGTAFREAEKARIEQIHHFANSDLEGRADEEHGNKNDRLANNGILRFLLKPLATFDQMLRHFGSKSVNGEGYLWNHFMRGWVDANDAEFKGLQAATKALDAKVSDVFGRKMRWSDLYAVERTMPTVDVKFWDGGKMKEHKLTQGNLLYIYMVDKMSDGRMKLRRMGIEEAHVEAIKNQMDPRFLELADWLQSEFLVGIRNKYNKVHVRMFGTPMAAIENYFPLKILANARVREVDMSTPDMDGTTPATITGSIIKRRRNALALDVIGTDAFSVVIEHLQQMEHWAAFAPFNRDLNTLLSYKKFRNRVQNMAGIYGAGSVIWENFRKSAEIAAGVYHPAVSKDSIDSSAVNIAKGVTAAKISFRVYTAIKQLLSMPAYISDANLGLLGKSLATPWKSWNWAMKELPGFEKRWRSRQAGDTRLMKTDSDWKLWRHNVVETASRLGMSPNAFVDALTVAIGAKAMYETRFKKYYHDGYTREQAEKRAKQDATILFNETQQSSENAFLSAMQLDRTWVSVALTVFRNSSMGFQRQLVDAVRNLGHKMQPGYKEKAIEFMTKQMVRDGVEEEDARAAAERNYKRSTFRDSMRVALFGFIMQFAWNLGAYLPYLIAGGDDDDKKKMLQDAARHGIVGGMVEGLSGGSVISEAANMLASGEDVANYNPSLMPVTSDIHKIIKLMSYDQVAAANEILNLLVQMGVGVNPQTVTNIGVAIYDACHGDLETSREAVLLLMRTLNVPESQTDKVLMDGIDFTAEKGLDMTISEFASRYADYKIRRNTAALGWMYSDEAREKRVNTYEKRFIKDAEEAKRTRGNEIDKAYYEYVDTEYKEVDKTLRELRSGLKSASMSGDQLGAMEYAEMLNNFMATPEYVKYAQVHGYQNAIKRLTSMLKDVNPKNRDQVEDQLLQLKKQMVTQIQKDNK